MPHRSLRRPFRILAIALCCLAVQVSADEVVLRNGDRLTGEVLSKSNGVLALQTAYAGRIEIAWDEVASLRTDGPVRLLIAGERRIIEGRLEADALGTRIDGRPEVMPLYEIAYINPRPEEAGLGVSYTGRANLSAAYSRGNTEIDRTYADAEMTARAARYRYTLGGKLQDSHEGGQQTGSAWLANAAWDRFIGGEKRFLYVRGSLEHDRFKDVDLRSTTGAGYGWQLVETAAADVSVRAGLDYVAEDRIVEADEDYPAFGWGIKSRYRFGRFSAELFHEHEGFWNLSETAEVIVRSRTGVRVPVMEKLSASLQLNLDWERRPAPGRKPTDSTLLLGATLLW